MKNNSKKVSSIIFLMIGILTLCIGCYVFISNKYFMENAEKTNAVIINIETKKHARGIRSGGGITHIVTVEYTVDGVEYESEINDYNSRMYEGKTIEVYYDPDNPSNVKTDSMLIPAWLMGIGILFTIIGCLFIATEKYRKDNKNHN